MRSPCHLHFLSCLSTHFIKFEGCLNMESGMFLLSFWSRLIHELICKLLFINGFLVLISWITRIVKK